MIRDEILEFGTDGPLRKLLSSMVSLIKKESQGIEDEGLYS